MIEIGSFIKLQRTKQEMTQGDLAKGIVSLSYLSKIENLKTEASPEIIQMLCTRLGIQIDNSLDATIQEKCKKWYSMLFEVNDKKDIIATYNEIQNLMDTNLTESLLLFEIHKIRYYLILGDFDEALIKINELNEISGTFDNLHLFYWYKFRGNYCSILTDFSTAIYFYKLAEEKLNKIEMEEHEIADLQYTIGVTHSKLRNTLEAIDYSNLALEVFMKQYNFIRCAQCHIILGISYRRIRMYDKAIKNLNLALHLGQLSNNNQIILLTHQNLGHLYSTRGDSNESIKHFQEVIQDDTAQTIDNLNSVASLVREYYNVQDYENAKKFVEQGRELIRQDSDREPYSKHYYYVINTYNYLLNDEFEKFEKFVIQDFIPYLNKQKDFATLSIYSELLANHYEKFGKYKKASKYYQVANFAYKQITNI
ncbi:transcriptional regulator [Oceanobacillus picturae]|uniref:Transcriptional activator NprA n=1 Tax=Oceanobacillus picturae TaxID=171693 RepID=W9BD81_9BACI|nr:helix-turn-helix domain-containing protein [Oceanobacillus picturae]RIU91449.1 helix-turn-helix domain-containing protein [Oceanobacillus picturae]GAQ18908.1 transcriptional regulator [Oceanobacillus picturae]CDO04260.1 Transcriptional activator NprA [Oceanobacillus picturae]